MKALYKKIGVGASPLLLDDRLFSALLILCVGIASFGLGRASVPQNTPEYGHEPTMVEQKDQVARAIDTKNTASSGLSEGQYVASKNGTRYHLPWCGSAKNIKEENKVWFATREEAEAAGYTPAQNCEGL